MICYALLLATQEFASGELAVEDEDDVVPQPMPLAATGAAGPGGGGYGDDDEQGSPVPDNVKQVRGAGGGPDGSQDGARGEWTGRVMAGLNWLVAGGALRLGGFSGAPADMQTCEHGSSYPGASCSPSFVHVEVFADEAFLACTARVCSCWVYHRSKPGRAQQSEVGRHVQ